ncbi:MAG: ABC transporter substrate-binding protein [Treponema sp.]|jgi:iron complex transport system substrate-binding protein|nr:ABC transporter substrate-binding protein [Treponema sp.]
MKKSVLFLMLVSALGAGLFARGRVEGNAPEQLETVKIIDTTLEEVEAVVNPQVVAIYDYSILDTLESVGFERTGIKTLVVPSRSTLPDALDYYKAEVPGTRIISGGSLFFIDWDVLDLADPRLVILGGRSFGMNASGQRLNTEDAATYRANTYNRYNNTRFIKLSVDASKSTLDEDIRRNVTALGSIFPALKGDLDARYREIKADMDTIKAKARQSGARALFVMTPDPSSISVFLPGSRFGMLYNEFGFTPADTAETADFSAHGAATAAEYILAVNPDVIFLLDRAATVGTEAGETNFKNDASIRQTAAFKNNRIYTLDGDSWYTMTGGIQATRQMIQDLMRFIDTL